MTNPTFVIATICLSFSYRLFVPEDQIASFYTIMQQNLNMEFPDYIITVELKGNEKCMIIKDTDD